MCDSLNESFVSVIINVYSLDTYIHTYNPLPQLLQMRTPRYITLLAFVNVLARMNNHTWVALLCSIESCFPCFHSFPGCTCVYSVYVYKRVCTDRETLMVSLSELSLSFLLCTSNPSTCCACSSDLVLIFLDVIPSQF